MPLEPGARLGPYEITGKLGAPVAPADSTRKMLDIAVQIADGMAAAHAAGFAHLDSSRPS